MLKNENFKILKNFLKKKIKMKKNWLKLDKAPIDRIPELFYKHEFLMTKWLKSKTKYNEQFKIMNSNINNILPYKLNDKIIHWSSDFNKHIGSIYYNGCNNKQCISHKKNMMCDCKKCDTCDKICNANIKILINKSNKFNCITGTILIKGHHFIGYIANKTNVKINPLLKKEIIEHMKSSVSIKSIIELYKNNLFFIDNSDKIRNILKTYKNNNKYKKFGYNNKENIFNKIINDIKYKQCDTLNVQCISSIENLNKMNENDYCITFCNIINMKNNIESIRKIIGLDSFYKCHKENGRNYPIFVITCMNNLGKGIPICISISSNEDSMTIKCIINDLKICYEKYSNLNFKPYIMIDDSPSTKKAIKELDLKYLLCKFHIFKSCKRWLNSNHYNEKEINEIFKIIRQIYNCKHKEDLNILIKILESYDNKENKPFYSHFIQQYYPNIECFCSMYRELNIGLFATNNITERYIRYLEDNWDKRKFYRLDVLIYYSVKILDEIKINNNLPLVESNLIKKIRNELLYASNNFLNYQIKISSEYNTIYYIENYEINVEEFYCNCIDYFQRCRTCKHLMIVLYYIFKNTAELNSLFKINKQCNPLEFLNILSLYIHSSDKYLNNYKEYYNIKKLKNNFFKKFFIFY